MLPEIGLGVVVLANGNDFTDETRIPQIRDNIILLLLGERPFEVTAVSDALTRWGKHLLALVVVGQVALAGLSAAPLGRLRQRLNLGRWGWSVLAAATVLDLVALALILFVIPRASGAPLQVTRSLPDFGPLIAAMMVGVGWGSLRTALAGYWGLFVGRARTAHPVAGNPSA